MRPQMERLGEDDVAAVRAAIWALVALAAPSIVPLLADIDARGSRGACHGLAQALGVDLRRRRLRRASRMCASAGVRRVRKAGRRGARELGATFRLKLCAMSSVSGPSCSRKLSRESLSMTVFPTATTFALRTASFAEGSRQDSPACARAVSLGTQQGAQGYGRAARGRRPGAARCAVSLSLRERRSQFPPQSGARASTCAKTKDRALVHGAAARAVAKRPERGIHVPFAPGSTRKNIRPAKNFLHCTSHARTHARRVLPRIRNASRDRMEPSRHRRRHEWRSSGEARADTGRLYASGLYVCLS